MIIQDKKPEFQKVLEHAEQDIGALRTNRATPATVENIVAEVYGSKMPLVQLASITLPEPKQLLIEPWDKNILKDVERAIETASLGFSVVNEGNFLRLTMAPMTEETRNEIIKMLSKKVEAGRVALRSLRDRIKEEIINQEKNKEISEDEKFRRLEELDKLTREFTEKLENAGKKKEAEIRL